jgi:hypothetical protein
MHTGFPAASRLALAAVSFCVCASAQTQYLAIDLGPASRANAIAAGQQGGYTCCGPTVTRHALLWSSSAATLADLHPLSATGLESGINAMAPGQQGGFVGSSAAIWNGTAASYFSIHPAGYTQSVVLGMGDTQIVGAAGLFDPTQPDSTIQHALLWTTPSAQSVIDLHPGGGWRSSFAYAAAGGKQVGAILNSTSEHAVIWSGSARSLVDLHNSKFITTVAYGISGARQVGFGYLQVPAGHGVSVFANHALMWSGSASTMVDLHPAAFSNSFARGLNATRQVGYGYTGTTYHALVWSGTAASVVDLHQFVPAGFPESDAFAIDAFGNIAGLAGDSLTNQWHAILWVPLL